MDVSKHIDRAEKEVARRNYDLAISLYEQIIALDPDNGPARTGKRRAELARYAKAYPSPLTRGVKNLPYTLGIGLAKAFRASGAVASMAEKALGNDPRNVKLNLALGHALLKQGHARGAEAAFAVVADAAPDDVESLKILGRLYYDNGKHDQSLACYERVIKLSPRDQEAVKMRKNLAAEGAIKSGGFEQAKSARDLAKSQEQLKDLEDRQKLVRSTDDVAGVLEKLTGELDERPDDADLRVTLGNLHLQQRDLKRAREMFTEAQRLRPEDADVADKLGDVRLLDLDLRIREARADVEAGEEGADDRVRRLVKERRTARVDEFRRRVKIHPTDSALRFRLGQYLLEDDQIDPAIAELQTVVRDPKRKYQAMTLLGTAFARKGLWELAEKQLVQALEGTGGVGERNLDIAYALAQACEEQGRREDAMGWYGRIYEIDIAHRDVAKKIEELRGSA